MNANGLAIEAQGLGFRATNTFWIWRWDDADAEANRIAYAWLLDANTRRPVWIMDSSNSEPDEDNPKGYYELEAVKRLKEDASFLEGATGRASRCPR